jgi:hypothetical protein
MIGTLCPFCDIQLTPSDMAEGWCDTCGKRLPPRPVTAAGRTGPPRRTVSRAHPEESGPAPWFPSQALGAAVVFGILSAGVVAGLNMARMGKRAYLLPCILAGALLFGVALTAFFFLLPDSLSRFDEGGRLVGMLTRLAIGVGFLLVQKDTFEAWKAANWDTPTQGRYRPGKIGQLFLVCLACGALEVGLIFLVAAAM